MMSVLKLKWSSVKTRKSLSELKKTLYDNQYSDAVEQGFLDVECTEKQISSKYIYKRVKSYESEGPFGEKIELELPEYIIFDFVMQKIDKGKYLIYIFDSPATIKPFVNYISGLLAYDFAVAPLNIDLESTISRLSGYVDQLKVSKLKVSGVKINSTAKAIVEVSSLNKGMEDLHSFVGEGNYRVDRVKGEARLLHSKVVFELSKHGTSLMSEKMIPVFKQVLSAAL